MPPRIYCGKNANAPAGAVKGTPGRCYTKGVGVGASLMEVHVALDTLTKDVVRDYAAKLRVPRYSTMSKAQLIDAINGSGKYRVGIQPKTWYL